MLSFDALAGVASAAATDGAPAFEGLDGAALLSEREHTSKLRRGSRAANATWQWQPVEYRGNPPTRREGHTAVAVENYLIIFGGCFLDRECFGDVKVRRSWLPPRRGAGSRSSAAAQPRRPADRRTPPQVFDTNLDRWFAPSMSGLGPTPREGHTASYVRDRIFVFGGSSEAGYLNDLHVLALVSRTAGEQLRLAWGTEGA